MGDSIELTLDYPIPDADWDKIMDVEFENTKSISFRTKSGKTVEFVKAERPKGKWIKPTGMMPPEYHGHYECSECGFWAMRDWAKPWKGVVLSKFCGGCGAEMLEEEDNGTN